MNIHTLNLQEAATLQEKIAASQHIVICCHRSPDGDAVGSSLGWMHYLQNQGKEAVVCIPDMMPDFLQWLPGSQSIVRYDRHPAQVERLFRQADLIFCLDFNAPSRLDDMEHVLTSASAPKIMIDHHLDPQMDTALTVSRPHMSSASELVFRIVWQLGGFETMDAKWASCIYCGMMTDTGGFVFNSNDPEVYFVISQLLTKGINKDKIYRQVFNNYSPSALRFRAYLISQKLQVIESLHAAYFTVTRQEMKDYHFIKGDLEGVVNEPLRIKGMKLSISLREDTEHDNQVLVSLRSVDDFPCNEVSARFFNGGGHLNASGGKLNCTLEEAEQVAQKAILAYAERLK